MNSNPSWKDNRNLQRQTLSFMDYSWADSNYNAVNNAWVCCNWDVTNLKQLTKVFKVKLFVLNRWGPWNLEHRKGNNYHWSLKFSFIVVLFMELWEMSTIRCFSNCKGYRSVILLRHNHLQSINKWELQWKLNLYWSKEFVSLSFQLSMKTFTPFLDSHIMKWRKVRWVQKQSILVGSFIKSKSFGENIHCVVGEKKGGLKKISYTSYMDSQIMEFSLKFSRPEC